MRARRRAPAVRGGLETDFAAAQLLYSSPLWNDGDIVAARAWWRRYMRRQRNPEIRQLMQEILEYAELLYSICPGPMRATMAGGIPKNPDRKRRPKKGWLFYYGAKITDPFPTCWRRG